MPSALKHSSSRLLEFDAFRALLAGYLSSPLGKARVSALAPTSDRNWINLQQQLAEEARQYLVAGGRFDFSALFDARSVLAKSRIEGAALEITELRDVLLLVDKAAEWREIALNPPEAVKAKWNGMRELSLRIADFTPLLRFFRNKISPDGTLDDRASPELARVRREV